MIVASGFRPAWWLPGPHLQTLWPRLHRRRLRPYAFRERLDLPDGDFLDLDWTADSPGRPLVLLLHGLEGSSSSPYAVGLADALARRGTTAAVMHFRGCSGEPNRLPRGYHSGDTGDLAWVVEQLRRRRPGRPLAAAGFSLGGNVLLKWLGETGADNPLTAAAAVSVPFRLERAVARLERGLSRFYQWALLRNMRASLRAKTRALGRSPVAVAPGALHSFRAFDEHVTAPLHGFAGADDYYARSSCRPFLAGIRVPTVVLHAHDDPFTTPEAIPDEDELAPEVRLELSDRGGHVGFVDGAWPWRPGYWLERRLCRFFAERVRGEL